MALIDELPDAAAFLIIRTGFGENGERRENALESQAVFAQASKLSSVP